MRVRFPASLLVIVLVACTQTGTTTSAGSSAPVVVTPSAHPSREPTPSSGPAKGGKQEPGGTLLRTIPLAEPVLALTGDGSSGFGLRRAAGGGAVPFRLDRPHRLSLGAPVRLAGARPTMLEVVDGTVWLATHHGVIGRIDPDSLDLVQTIDVGTPILDIDSSDGRLWVFSRDRVVAFGPYGARAAAFHGESGITAGAVSPDDSRVYVSLDGPVRRDHLPVLELDASTGSILARTWSGEADLTGISGLTATNRGVWITFATGIMGLGEFARASDLRRHHHEVGTPGGPIPGTNAIRLWPSGGALWQSSGSLICYDPTTGKEIGPAVAGHIPFGLGYEGVAATTSGVWAAHGHVIWRLRPPTRCGTRTATA